MTCIRISRNSSVLVVGAHPGDAVRSNAGVILRAMSAGAKVIVVKATNGAALGGPERIPVGRKQADTRKREELAALKVLGFPRKNHLLLGFPDGGLEPMRFDYFDRTGLPYLCPWLASDRTFGADVYRKGVPFFGADMVAVLKTIMGKAKPTHVFTHCSRDRPPDHRAITWFAKRALAELKLKPRVYEWITYYHRLPWPPKGPSIPRAAAERMPFEGEVVEFVPSAAEQSVKVSAWRKHTGSHGAAYVKRWTKRNEAFWRTA